MLSTYFIVSALLGLYTATAAQTTMHLAVAPGPGQSPPPAPIVTYQISPIANEAGPGTKPPVCPANVAFQNTFCINQTTVASNCSSSITTLACPARNICLHYGVGTEMNAVCVPAAQAAQWSPGLGSVTTVSVQANGVSKAPLVNNYYDSNGNAILVPSTVFRSPEKYDYNTTYGITVNSDAAMSDLIDWSTRKAMLVDVTTGGVGQVNVFTFVT